MVGGDGIDRSWELRSVRANARSGQASRCRQDGCRIHPLGRLPQHCDPSVHHTRSRGGHAMSSRLRRSLALTTLLVLLLAVSGATAPIGPAAPASPAANPPTTVGGIDVDATTIPQLQSFMNSHRLSSV